MRWPHLGRLFWKFFAFFWLAQIVTALVVGTVVWWHRSPDSGPPPHAPHRMERPLHPPGGPARMPRFILPVVAGGLVSLVFAAWLAFYFSRPIRSLRQALEAAANGQLHTRIGPALADRRDELSDLGADFDRMAEQLKLLIDSQQRLLHDVSHELRSPLARLQAVSDLLIQRPERVGEFLPRVELECQRIDQLVGELLTLSRVDAGLTGQAVEAVDLCALLDELAEDLRLEGANKQLAVELAVPPQPVLLQAPNDLLARAISNVTRNALRHAPANSVIDIRLMATDAAAGWRIEISDRGPGVVESELPRIFEPFVRGRDTRPHDGFGLGLAISRRIIKSLRGQIGATNRAGGGLTVAITLPKIAD